MFKHIGKKIRHTQFARRILRSFGGERSLYGSLQGRSVKEPRARFSFPVIVFLASLIISPMIFFTAIAGEKMFFKLISRVQSYIAGPSSEASSPIWEEDCDYFHPLDGTCLSAPWDAKKIIAVSIDNIVEARPPSGLASARLVIEAPVEAGITRFLAFWGEGDEVPEIGPIRSARPYFIDWAKSYKSTLVHVGGSPEALLRIKNEKVLSLDGMRDGEVFFRDGRRFAPHNTYALAKKIFESVKRSGDLDPPPILSKDEVTPGKKDSFLRIPAASSAYEVQWKYDHDKNEYLRLQAGVSAKDKDGAEVRAKNVIVLKTQIEITDEIGRREIKTIGEGEAIVLRSGERILGRWKRLPEGGRILFFDKDGVEIKMLAGKTWIEVVSTGAKVEYN